MSESAEPPFRPKGIAFHVRVEISPENLKLIGQAAAIEGIDRQAFLRRAAAVGIRDSLRDAAVLVAFSDNGEMPPGYVPDFARISSTVAALRSSAGATKTPLFNTVHAVTPARA